MKWMLLCYGVYSSVIAVKNIHVMKERNPILVGTATVMAPILCIPSGVVGGCMGAVFAAAAANNNNGREPSGIFVTAGAGLAGGVFGAVFGAFTPLSLLSPFCIVK